MEKYPYGYCGMPCALCSRYRTDGKSKCEGCSDGGYYSYGCRVYKCTTEKTIEHCGCCKEFPCIKMGKLSDFRDLNTHGEKLRACSVVAEKGFEAWYAEYSERADLLGVALKSYNDGRMKRYLCELFICADIAALRKIMSRAKALPYTGKELSAAFKTLVTEILSQA